MRRVNDLRTEVLAQARKVLKEKRRRAAFEARRSDPLWRRWARIKSQGRNPDPARHVKVTARWANSFEEFESCVGRPNNPSHRLFLIYACFGWRPGNTIWRAIVPRKEPEFRADPGSEARAAGLSKEEARALWDRLSEHEPEWMPETTPADWGGMARKAEELGVPPGVYYVRISRGWSKEKALATPIGPWGGQKKVASDPLQHKV